VEVVQGEIEKHCEDNMGQHLLLLLNSLQNQKLSIGVQSQRIQLIEKAMAVGQRGEAGDMGSVQSTLREHEIRLNSLEQELKKLQQDVKATDVSAEVLQLRREVRNLQRQNCNSP
jgi:flagellin-like hook-associated protein FlgL